MNELQPTIRAMVIDGERLARYWRLYFQETPVCSVPGCGCVAAEVDSFFPYIDDNNRCKSHPLAELTISGSHPHTRTGCSGAGSEHGIVADVRRWRRPNS